MHLCYYGMDGRKQTLSLPRKNKAMAHGLSRHNFDLSSSSDVSVPSATSPQPTKAEEEADTTKKLVTSLTVSFYCHSLFADLLGPSIVCKHFSMYKIAPREWFWKPHWPSASSKETSEWTSLASHNPKNFLQTCLFLLQYFTSSCLSDWLQSYCPTRSLCSSGDLRTLNVPNVRCKTKGDRSFPYFAQRYFCFR